MIPVTDEMRGRAYHAARQFAIAHRHSLPDDRMLDDVIAAVLALVERDYPATEYTVSALPEDDVNAHHFSIKVAYRGGGRWAVLHNGWCLNRAGQWEYEHVPSERTDEWLAEHRFPLGEALAMARAELPRLVVNGMTTAQAVARSSAPPL